MCIKSNEGDDDNTYIIHMYLAQHKLDYTCKKIVEMYINITDTWVSKYYTQGFAIA